MQVGGAEVHWPEVAHSMLSAPCSSWPWSQLKVQIVPCGWGVPTETVEEREGDMHVIRALGGITGVRQSSAAKKEGKRFVNLSHKIRPEELKIYC